MSQLCLHCRQSGSIASRGLCQACYADLDIRLRYPVGQALRQGVAQTEGHVEPEPTRTIPGTEERIVELARRAESGERLWTPGDLTIATMRDEMTTPTREPDCWKHGVEQRNRARVSERPECHAEILQDVQRETQRLA